MFLKAAQNLGRPLERVPLGARFALALLLPVLIDAFATSSAEAGVILCDQQSLRVLSDGGMSATTPPLSEPADDELPRTLQELASLPAGHAGGAGTAGASASGGVSAPAACGAVCVAPEPTLVAWLANGQCPFLPPLLPSGLFRPPRA